LILAVAVLICAAQSCRRADPAEPAPWEAIGIWPPGLRQCLEIGDGRWSWNWRGPDRTRGEATLTVAGSRYRWRLDPPPPEGEIELICAVERWLSFRLTGTEQLTTMPPLPRLPCDSAAFDDLVAMLRALITPRFAGRVPHWPDWPIPVRAPEAASGGLDLAACLREAVTLWQEGASPFVWDDDASWGVRLAHYAGTSRSPPMQLQITRLDEAGRPLRARIAVGDDYSAGERTYAVRAMAHELAHAALLWGHSPDREHLLWGAAPPLRADPSADERRAVQLLHRLPEGLDLNRYGPAKESRR
jgi:hypothetical protein